MKKSLLLSSLCIAAVLVSQTAQAEVKIRAGTGTSTYTLSGDYGDATSKYTPISLGVTFAFDNGMYIDLAHTSGTGEHDGWAWAGYPSEKFKRSETALTFGRSHVNENNGIAIGYYAGLKTGTTTLGAQNVPFFIASWMEETLTTSGVVLGGGASFPIASGRGGAIGVNLGIGFMGTTWEDDTGWNQTSDTAVGYSYGVSYTYPIIPNFGVTVDYKGNNYKYDFGNILGKTAFTVNETITALGASVYVKF